MAIKSLISLVTVPGSNEQSAASPVTVTATGNSREYREFSNFQRALLFLDVTAASGTTPNLVVSLQVQDEISLKWSTVTSFPAQTAATAASPGLSPIQVDLYGMCYRLVWTVTGTTPSFTFSCAAIAGTEEPLS